MRFWDTSALVKLYVAEADSAQFRHLATDPEALLISSFTIHELHCAFWRKELSGAIDGGAAEILFESFLRQIDSGRFRVVIYESKTGDRAMDVVRRCYRTRRPTVIRSLDALQIASALEGAAAEIVSADLRMRKGGGLFGLRVLPD
jgi:predicted nucleic acid-binding protein